MIKNQRQYSASQRKLAQLREAMATAETETDRSALEVLANEIDGGLADYERLTAGQTLTFEINSLDDIPDALVKARIGQGLTQRQLAERLGTSEQQVQRDEAGGYERASFYRVADAADALGYELVGVLALADEAMSYSSDTARWSLYDTAGIRILEFPDPGTHFEFHEVEPGYEERLSVGGAR